MRRGELALVIVVVGFGAWTACVGTDTTASSTPPGKGAQNQPCFENQTCLVGLACADGICIVDPGEGGAGPSSSTTSSSSTSGGTTSGGTTSSSASGGTSGGTSSGTNYIHAAAKNCGLLSNGDRVTCPIAPDGEVSCTKANRFCCAGRGCQANETGCPSANGPFECLSTLECGVDKLGICCVAATLEDGDDCLGGGKILTTTSSPHCGGACAIGQLELCATGAPCKNGHTCTAVEFPFTGTHSEAYRKAVGVCPP